MKTILTGIRATGRIHLGHYVGCLQTCLEMQKDSNNKLYVMIADLQSLTDNAKYSKKITSSVLEIALDYLAIGLDPSKTTIFVQSQVPQLFELTMYFLNLTTVSRLKRNPTVKKEIEEKKMGQGIPAGFFIYPVSQAADIAAFKADLVPVGEDQKPMLELTKEIIYSFNSTYKTNILVPPQAFFSDKIRKRLPGIDGNKKMSKSLNNDIGIDLSLKDLENKVMKMYTDPNHFHIQDPGIVEGNTVFTYLDVFGKNTKYIKELKEQYRIGGLGDVKIKRYLLDILEEEIKPIRSRRKILSKNSSSVIEILKKGSKDAKKIAQKTLDEVKKAMHIFN